MVVHIPASGATRSITSAASAAVAGIVMSIAIRTSSAVRQFRRRGFSAVPTPITEHVMM